MMCRPYDHAVYLFLVVIVTAYAYSAVVPDGNCPAGPMTFHGIDANYTSQPTTINQYPTLTEAGLRLTMNNVDISTDPANNNQIYIYLGGDYELSVSVVQSSSDDSNTKNDAATIKNALVRVAHSKEHGRLTLVEGSHARILVECAANSSSVGGVIHTDNDNTHMSGFLRVSSTGILAVDVSVELSNNSTGSLYAYQSWEIGVITSYNTLSLTEAPTPMLLELLAPTAMDDVEDVQTSFETDMEHASPTLSAQEIDSNNDWRIMDATTDISMGNRCGSILTRLFVIVILLLTYRYI